MALTKLNGSQILDASINVSKIDATNGNSELIETTAEGLYPALNGSLITDIDADNIASGTLNDGRLSSNVTLMGNEFNDDNELVKLDSDSKLPAVDGSQLTGITASQVGAIDIDALSTDDTLGGASPSDSLVPSQAAVKAYVDGLPPSEVTIGREIVAPSNGQTQIVLQQIPNTNSEDVYVNGELQAPGGSYDYTLSSKTITFNFSLKTSDLVVIKYNY